MKKDTFLIVSPYHWCSVLPSGIANSCMYLSMALSDFGDVTVFSSNVGLKKTPNVDIPNVKISLYKVFFSDRYLFSINFFWKIISHLRANTVIVLNEYYSLKIIFLIVLNKLFFNRKVIFFPRGSLIRDQTISFKKLIFDYLFLSLYRLSDLTILTSHYEFTKSVDTVNAVLLPNCYIPRVSCVSDSSFNINSPYFLYLNEISKDKGFDFLMRSWKKFHNKNPRYQLIVIGRVKENYIKSFENYKSSFTDLNIIYKGVIKGARKDHIISEALMTLLTSYSENFSNIVIESLSLGVPVLATHGTPWDSLSVNKCGYFIPHDSFKFCNALEEFVQLNNATRLQMKVNSKTFFDLKYSFSIYKQTLGNHLKLLLK